MSERSPAQTSRVIIDFSARGPQLRYGVKIPDETKTIFVWGLQYESLWAAAPGWDYLTEENAEPSIRLLCENITQIVLLRNRVFDLLQGSLYNKTASGCATPSGKNPEAQKTNLRLPTHKMENIGAQFRWIVIPIAVDLPAGPSNSVVVLATPLDYCIMAYPQLFVWPYARGCHR